MRKKEVATASRVDKNCVKRPDCARPSGPARGRKWFFRILLDRLQPSSPAGSPVEASAALSYTPPSRSASARVREEAKNSLVRWVSSQRRGWGPCPLARKGDPIPDAVRRCPNSAPPRDACAQQFNHGL